MNKKFISIRDIEQNKIFCNYEKFEELGRGANGVVFKATHKFTNQLVAIKVYAIFSGNSDIIYKKHLLEIRKNSETRLTKDQALVFDAGEIIINNETFLYSIMNYLDGITLLKWIEERDKNDLTILLKKQIEINAALGFLYACYNLIENDYGEISHGDLNDGNVIFLSQSKYRAREDGFFKYCTCNGQYLVPTNIEFIDYGTSEWERTNHENGIKRDLRFILDNTKKILSSYPIEQFINYDSIISETSDCAVMSRRYNLIVDLIRIILSLYFLDNIYHIEDYTKECEDWVYKIWYGSFNWDYEFEFNSFINLEYWTALKLPSKGEYIKEKEIINYINKTKSEIFNIEFTEKYKKIKLILKK